MLTNRNKWKLIVKFYLFSLTLDYFLIISIFTERVFERIFSSSYLKIVCNQKQATVPLITSQSIIISLENQRLSFVIQLHKMHRKQ